MMFKGQAGWDDGLSGIWESGNRGFEGVLERGGVRRAKNK